ncbi:AF4/FMR2 family member 4-like isoform X2 [Trichogramma pretiosum]|uniref:AF4/FMR2 family member 4-like isoform X2 n=1 Tax=Trichogramma pretiosum TaxID=7493 RepID=UPI0006C9BD7A|nr:AF4/FMR2 family member 4-like isoform X2 [Trichogramma pretiosum]
MGNMVSSTVGDVVHSTLTLFALRVAWLLQLSFDPTYSLVEGRDDTVVPPRKKQQITATDSTDQKAANNEEQQQQQQQQSPHQSCSSPQLSNAQAKRQSYAHSRGVVETNSDGNPQQQRRHTTTTSLHQLNRQTRRQQLKSKTLPSSFDASLLRSAAEATAAASAAHCTVLGNSSAIMQRPAAWELSLSSSGCSSNSSASSMESDSDSETALRVSINTSTNELQDEKATKCMIAAEKEAFRRTCARGYFTRSKKDRFLNHLRMEKRLNDHNLEAFGIALKRHTLPRCSGSELQRLV